MPDLPEADQPIDAAAIVRAPLFVETPTVEDLDEERDLTPFVEAYAKNLQSAIVRVASQSRRFSACVAAPQKGAYRLATHVTINNFRAPQGGGTLFVLGGIFLPPILGFAWAAPVGFGTVDGQISWSLYAPSGELLTTISDSELHTGDGIYHDTTQLALLLKTGNELALQQTASPTAVAAGASPAGDATAATAAPKAADAAGNAAELVLGAPQRNAFALVVGIDKYRDAPAAPNARTDAERFAALARTTLGLPDDQVRLVVDERAGLVDIRRGLKWLKSSVPAGGRAYFFFAGHGAPDASAGTPYLLPYDGAPKDLKESAIELQEVLAELGGTAGAQSIAIVDACFSGAGGRSVLPEGARPRVRVRTASTGAKVGLFSASTGAEISGPDRSGKGGLFTSVLVEGIGRASADIDGNGDVTLGEIATWVAPRVKREASALGREQSPGLTLGVGINADEVVLGAGLGNR
jgi:hypothetical protein